MYITYKQLLELKALKKLIPNKIYFTDKGEYKATSTNLFIVYNSTNDNSINTLSGNYVVLAYDELGNVISKSVYDNNTSYKRLLYKTDFTYDSIGNITKSTINNKITNSNSTKTFSYDSNNNIININNE